MSSGRPISPSEVADVQQEVIPGGVFDVVNSLIATNMSGKTAHVKQKQVVAALENQGFTRGTIYDKNWLNFEEAYRRMGWKVVYDKPGYSESYDAHWIFTTP